MTSQLAITLTDAVIDWATKLEYVPAYDNAAFADFVARSPKLFAVEFVTGEDPALIYHDPMASPRRVGIISGIASTNAAGPSRVRAVEAAKILGLRYVE